MLTVQDNDVPFAKYNVLSVGYYEQIIGDYFLFRLTPDDSNIIGDTNLNLTFTGSNVHYIKGSWGQDGTILGNDHTIADRNTMCSGDKYISANNRCDIVPGSSVANRIRILGMKTQVSDITTNFTYTKQWSISTISNNGSITLQRVLYA